MQHMTASISSRGNHAATAQCRTLLGKEHPWNSSRRCCRGTTCASGHKHEAKRGGQFDGIVSEKSSHTTPCCLRLLAAADVEMSTVPMPVDAKETNALCEDQIEQPDVDAFFERKRSQPQRESSTRTYFTKPALGPSSIGPSCI